MKTTVNQLFRMLFLVSSFIVIIQNNLFAQVKLSEENGYFLLSKCYHPTKIPCFSTASRTGALRK